VLSVISICIVLYLDEASKNWKLSRRLPADFLELHCQLLPDS
jgi:hypothetical protein